MSEENGNILDLGSIDFTPDWAKKDAGVNVGQIRPERDEGGKGMRDEGRGMRKSFGDRKPFGGPPSRSFGAAGKKPFSKKPFTGARRPRPEFERPKTLEAEVKILPEIHSSVLLRPIGREVDGSKVEDIAVLFAHNSHIISYSAAKPPRFTDRAASPCALTACLAVIALFSSNGNYANVIRSRRSKLLR